MAGVVGAGEGEEVHDGFIRRGDVLVELTDVELDVTYDVDDLPAAIDLRLSAGDERLSASGTVLTVIPLRNRKVVDGEVTATRICECAVRWEFAGEGGPCFVGIAELLDQVVDGVPVGLPGDRPCP